MDLHVRIARPVSDLRRSVAMYTQGLGLAELGGFVGHAGLDGTMLGLPERGFHFEFTHRRMQPVAPAPTAEDLLVFYVPEPLAWKKRCAAMLAAGFVEVEVSNPYWGQNGRGFQDHDGYTVVIQRSSWPAGHRHLAPAAPLS